MAMSELDMAHLSFDNVKVPDIYLLAGDAMITLLRTLTLERYIAGVVAHHCLQTLFDEATAYCRSHTVNHSPLIQYQHVRFSLSRFKSASEAGSDDLQHDFVHSREFDAEDYTSMEDINEQAEIAAARFAGVGIDVLAYGFTTATFYRGVAYAGMLQSRLSSAAGVPVVLPALAILEALDGLRATRIAVTTPYPEWNNRVLASFLAETKYDVVGFAGDDRPLEQAKETGYRWGETPEEVLLFVTDHCPADADAMLCPCTAWRSFEIVDEIERSLGIPVVTANQAVIWSVRRLLGINTPPRVGGRLLTTAMS
jgi:maleate isomerase